MRYYIGGGSLHSLALYQRPLLFTWILGSIMRLCGVQAIKGGRFHLEHCHHVFDFGRNQHQHTLLVYLFIPFLGCP